MKIEELTDQLEQAATLHESGTTSADVAADATKPALPPGLAINSGKTAEEILADLNKSPLFMTELEDNDAIAALQAMNYEGSALENAADFKERGNECFKVKGYVDAREFYAKGISVLFIEERKRKNGEITTNPEGEPDSEEEIALQKEMLEALYVNRAACNLELDNYRACWLDCTAALRLNPKNLKAYYRASKALLAVDRIEEADDMCARGLALDGENKGLKAVAEALIKRALQIEAKQKKEAERLATEKRREYLLKAALAARNIPSRTTEQPPEMEDAKMTLVPDPDDPRSRLSIPAVLLYPLHLESDFIKGFEETHTLEDHLGYVFPLPWDTEHAYTLPNVTCYVETKDGGLLKMGKKASLLKVLSTGKVEIVDQVVRIFILPTDKADEWIKKFKEQKAATKGKQ